jgi:hypothetical protein
LSNKDNSDIDGPCYWTGTSCEKTSVCSQLTYDGIDNTSCLLNQNNDNIEGICYWKVYSCARASMCSDLTYDGANNVLCESEHSLDLLSDGDRVDGPCIWDDSDEDNNICRRVFCNVYDDNSDDFAECTSSSVSCDVFYDGSDNLICNDKQTTDECSSLGRTVCISNSFCNWDDADAKGCSGKENCEEIIEWR